MNQQLTTLTTASDFDIKSKLLCEPAVPQLDGQGPGLRPPSLLLTWPLPCLHSVTRNSVHVHSLVSLFPHFEARLLITAFVSLSLEWFSFFPPSVRFPISFHLRHRNESLITYVNFAQCWELNALQWTFDLLQRSVSQSHPDPLSQLALLKLLMRVWPERKQGGRTTTCPPTCTHLRTYPHNKNPPTIQSWMWFSLFFVTPCWCCGVSAPPERLHQVHQNQN